jgi:Ca2+-transporting ATPase
MAPTQILWINLVASVALAVPLAFEAPEPDLMERRPRDPQAPLLNRFVVFRTVLVAVLMAAGSIGLFLYEYDAALDAGVSNALALAEAQTMAVTTVVMFQIFYVLNCRSLNRSIWQIGVFSNRAVYAGIVGLFLLQLAFVYTPIANAIFGSAPISAAQFGLSVLVGMVILPVIAVEKRIRARRTDAGA